MPGASSKTTARRYPDEHWPSTYTADRPAYVTYMGARATALELRLQYKRYVADEIFDTKSTLKIERAGQPFDAYKLIGHPRRNA
jgi:hypothetical protein